MKESALRLESLPFSRKTDFAPAASVARMETQPSVYHDPENLPEFRPNPVSAPGASFKLSINCGKLPGFLPANALAGQALTESPAAERPRECRDAFRGCSHLAPQNHRRSGCAKARGAKVRGVPSPSKLRLCLCRDRGGGTSSRLRRIMRRKVHLIATSRRQCHAERGPTDHRPENHRPNRTHSDIRTVNFRNWPVSA
jgi:hypothetical protein